MLAFGSVSKTVYSGLRGLEVGAAGGWATLDGTAEEQIEIGGERPRGERGG